MKCNLNKHIKEHLSYAYRSCQFKQLEVKPNMSRFGVHLRMLEVNQKFYCPECNCKLADKTEMKQHLRDHHLINKLTSD